MADAHARRNGGEVAEGRLAPLEEGIALTVSLELQQGIGRKAPAAPNSSTCTE